MDACPVEYVHVAWCFMGAIVCGLAGIGFGYALAHVAGVAVTLKVKE